MDLIFIIVAKAITGVMAIMAAIPVIALTTLMPTLMTIINVMASSSMSVAIFHISWIIADINVTMTRMAMTVVIATFTVMDIIV